MNTTSKITFVILSSIMFLSAANGQPARGTGENRPESRRERPFVLQPNLNENVAVLSRSQNTELRCRGGEGFSFQSVGERAHSSGAAIAVIEMAFAPGLLGAGSLKPGECAPVQRAFYLDEVGQVREPLRVRFETPANAQLKQTQSGSEVDLSSGRAESYPDANSIPDYLKSPDRYWTFYVSNSGQGYFSAVSHQHWKPATQGTSVNRNARSLIRQF